MLVLTRKEDEGIYIGEKIYIKITNIRRKQIKIAIEAPLHISIYREETKELLNQISSDIKQRANVIKKKRVVISS